MMAESTRFATVTERDLQKLLLRWYGREKQNELRRQLWEFQNYSDYYLKEKNRSEPQEKGPIAGVLKLFFAEARKVGRTSYSKSTLNSTRGLNSDFKSTRGFDIINDSEFTEVSKVFGARCVELKRQGLAKVELTPRICEEDLEKLYECSVFNVNR